MNPRVVCIGCGTGQAQVLRALLPLNVDLSGLVGVTDNGGHSGALRREFGIPQVGDLRQCLAAVLPEDHPTTGILGFRLNRPPAEGVSLGNLLIASVVQKTKSLSAAAVEIQERCGVPVRVLPVSDDDIQICAQLDNGRIIRGEWQIIRRRPRRPIINLFHHPSSKSHPEAIKRIRNADVVIFCPGSLQTGLISALLPRGIREALLESRARKIQICNIMSQPGNTDDFTLFDHVALLTRYAGKAPDFLIVNTAHPPKAWLAPYRREGAHLIERDIDELTGIRILGGDFLESRTKDVLRSYTRAGNRSTTGPHFIRHDARKLAQVLRGVIFPN